MGTRNRMGRMAYKWYPRRRRPRLWLSLLDMLCRVRGSGRGHQGTKFISNFLLDFDASLPSPSTAQAILSALLQRLHHRRHRLRVYVYAHYGPCRVAASHQGRRLRAALAPTGAAALRSQLGTQF